MLRYTADGRLLYANPASSPIARAWGVSVGDPLPSEWLDALGAAIDTGKSVEIRCDDRTYSLLAISVTDLGFTNVYGTDVTAWKLIERFPDANPNPVLRITDDGRVRYANPASGDLLTSLGCTVGDPLPDELCRALFDVLEGRATGAVETRDNGHTFALVPVRIPELGMINVYGTDTTARTAIQRFPDANPNPVFRVEPDGTLVYANPASTSLIDGLGCRLGSALPDGLLRPLLELAGDAGRGAMEVAAGGRVYALLPVDVAAFGFINVYGTDITAVRQLEEAHRENERLLLNILPEPIADRLRHGETLIADRFDDVTLLIADIVEFTRLSAGMSADELVTVLNEVFTVFDQLVEKYGLEKVKTIGDAYMVVGGMPERSDDHAERLASMALDLAERVAGIDAAARLGVRFRIGMHCGPVVAGVIGTKKFIYDIWGDTVNLASRMESHGVPGRIQVTGAIEQRLRSRFRFEPRGVVDVKGKGPTPTWFLIGNAVAGAVADDRSTTPGSDAAAPR
ncbi:MAG: adenylate/guanylate cyclase domain-containing protein [Chloroflexota bacterium]